MILSRFQNLQSLCLQMEDKETPKTVAQLMSAFDQFAPRLSELKINAPAALMAPAVTSIANNSTIHSLELIIDRRANDLRDIYAVDAVLQSSLQQLQSLVLVETHASG